MSLDGNTVVVVVVAVENEDGAVMNALKEEETSIVFAVAVAVDVVVQVTGLINESAVVTTVNSINTPATIHRAGFVHAPVTPTGRSALVLSERQPECCS